MNAHQKFETIVFSRKPTSKPVAADARAELLKDPGFGRVFTDHMVTIRWTKDRGWHDAQVGAREPITLDPAAAVLHYGQEIFELSEQLIGYPNDPNYIAARTHARNTARSGIDNALTNDDLDAIVAPHLTNSTGPAVAGYPNLSLPVGIRESGRPAGMLMYSTFLREPELIGFGYDLEQELNVRAQPQFLGSVIPVPNADLCTGQQRQTQVFTGRAHTPHGRIF